MGPLAQNIMQKAVWSQTEYDIPASGHKSHDLQISSHPVYTSPDPLIFPDMTTAGRSLWRSCCAELNQAALDHQPILPEIIFSNSRYISPICPEAPHRRICTKYGTAIAVADVITCGYFLVIG